MTFVPVVEGYCTLGKLAVFIQTLNSYTIFVINILRLTLYPKRVPLVMFVITFHGFKTTGLAYVKPTLVVALVLDTPTL